MQGYSVSYKGLQGNDFSLTNVIDDDATIVAAKAAIDAL